MSAERITIGAAGGLSATLSPLGAALHRLLVPTPDGPVNVVLGYREPADYREDAYYMGAVIGRFAGRINRGHLTLAGRSYTLNTEGNPDGHCLHGGAHGFHRRRWSTQTSERACDMRYVAGAGEQGFPGALTVDTRYEIDGLRLTVRFRATSTAPTVVNLTQHAYFNLSGESTIDNHRVRIDAQSYVPLADNLVPLGTLAEVANTPLDLRDEVALGQCFKAGVPGFDHYFVRGRGDHDAIVASVHSPTSGIRLDVRTTQPGLQFYTGHYLGHPFVARQGLCVETQGFPDAPNQPAFESALLEPDATYEHTTKYDFSV